MQVFFVIMLIFFALKLRRCRLFFFLVKYIYEQTFLKLPAALQTFILGQINLQIFLRLGFPLGAKLKKSFHTFNFGQINFQTFFLLKTLGFLLGAILKKTFQTFNLGRLRVWWLLFCWGLNRLSWALNRYCVFVLVYYSQFFVWGFA